MSTVFSPCATYRYTLSRQWLLGQGTLLFVMLNPSTADAVKNDPTVTRCIKFAQDWGFQQLLVANMFAFRSPKPADLYTIEDPIGPENDEWIARLAEEADSIVVAWGSEKIVKPRESVVLDLLGDPQRVRCLGTTASGHPQHPLYMRADTQPVAFRPTRPDERVSRGPAPSIDSPLAISFMGEGWMLNNVEPVGVAAWRAQVTAPGGRQATRTGLTAIAAVHSAIDECGPRYSPPRGDVAKFVIALEQNKTGAHRGGAVAC